VSWGRRSSWLRGSIARSWELRWQGEVRQHLAWHQSKADSFEGLGSFGTINLQTSLGSICFEGTLRYPLSFCAIIWTAKIFRCSCLTYSPFLLGTETVVRPPHKVQVGPFCPDFFFSQFRPWFHPQGGFHSIFDVVHLRHSIPTFGSAVGTHKLFGKLTTCVVRPVVPHVPRIGTGARPVVFNVPIVRM